MRFDLETLGSMGTTCCRVSVVLFVCASACFAGQATTMVRGFPGEPEEGYNGEWFSHLGSVRMSVVRQKAPNTRIEWKSAPLPGKIATPKVTFTWTGAFGYQQSEQGNFSLWVNGREAAICDVVIEPTRFVPASPGCELLYDAIWVHSTRCESSGFFYLTVPGDWVRPNEPARLEIRAKDMGTDHWLGLIRANDAPLSVPDRSWRNFVARHTGPANPPPAGQEASYEWYVPQFSDPGILTTIGPPADAAETAVSPAGSLFYACDRGFEKAPQGYLRHALAFGLCDGTRIVPVGFGEPARQEVADGMLPIVTTTWKSGPIEMRQTCFAEPLHGTSYETGRERTLAWAAFDLTNRKDTAQEITLLGFHVGDEKDPRPACGYRDGVVLRNDSALFSAQAPAGFRVEFQPVFPAGTEFANQQDVLESFRQRKAVFNALAIGGRIDAGQTVRFVFNRVFDFRGANHWIAQPQSPVAPKELTERSFDKGFQQAKNQWRELARPFSARFVTPDPILNRIVSKAMLDGFFLTKRWNGRYIVFDSVVYRCQWDDASTKWFYALDLMGDHATSERLLDTVFARQGQRKPAGTRTHEGCFSDVTNIQKDGSKAAWASCNGWALWAMAEHARLANDRQWLDQHKKQILDGCDWIIRERSFSRERKDNPCAGLLEGKFVCDMPDTGEKVSGVGYFTYTDAISYMGLHETAQLLSEWGHVEGERLLQEAEAYRRDIMAAIDLLTDKSRDPWYVPWALHAPRYEDRYLYDVCGPINLAYGGVLPRDDGRIGHVIRWLIDHVHQGSVESAAAGGWKYNSGAMFYSQDLAVTLLELGRVEEFLRILYTLLAANISHETLTTCEWKNNTQPHIHSISSLIRMFRTMHVQERDGNLYLLQGTPRRWLEHGKEIHIEDAPTWYGPLSLHVVSRVKDGLVQVRLKAPARIGEVPIHLKLRLPAGLRITGVTLNGGKPVDAQGEWLLLRGMQGEANIEATVNTR